MTVVFLVAFIAGLALAVRVMLFGIERGTVPPSQLAPSQPGIGRPRVRLSMPALGAFAVVFGVVGYLLLRTGTASSTAALVALGAGAVAAALAVWGSAAWARVVPEHDVDDPRYVLQGHLAQVTRPIEAGEDGAEGEIVFEIGTERRVVRARGLDGVGVDVGTEVVIERIEGEVAWVEPWVEVERRL